MNRFDSFQMLIGAALLSFGLGALHWPWGLVAFGSVLLVDYFVDQVVRTYTFSRVRSEP